MATSPREPRPYRATYPLARFADGETRGTGATDTSRSSANWIDARDGEVIEFSQQAFESKPFHRTLAELGGREVEDTEHMVTETLIRGMYRYWRDVMEAE